jgi:hypothetical protein
MKTCPSCNESFEGRKNKTFCSLYCKSAFNYDKDKNKPLTRFGMVDKQLRLNRKILAKFNQAGKSTIRKQKILDEGFDPRCITGWWKNKKGETYLFCYDHGFIARTENAREKYVLIKWQDYMA